MPRCCPLVLTGYHTYLAAAPVEQEQRAAGCWPVLLPVQPRPTAARHVHLAHMSRLQTTLCVVQRTKRGRSKEAALLTVRPSHGAGTGGTPRTGGDMVVKAHLSTTMMHESI